MSKRSSGADRSAPPPVPEPITGPDGVPLALVDAHTHLDACGARTPQALVDVLERAGTAGVAAVVTTADDLASARWAAWAAGVDPRVAAAVGLHPTRSRDLDEAARAEIEALAHADGVVAVGETGLDDYWTTRRPDCAPLAVQREAFAWHLDLARRTGLPVVIHDREVHAGIVEVLAGEGAPDTVVFHCFSGDVDLATRCAEEGWFCSFSGTVTFRNATELRDAAVRVPRDLVLVETDAPFLTPHPYRGRPNDPACVPYTVRDLARLRGEDAGELAAATAATARRVFGLGEPPVP